LETVVGVVDVVDFESGVEGAVEGAVVEEGGDGTVGSGLDSVLAAAIADEVVLVAVDEVEGIAVARGVVDFGDEAAEVVVLPRPFAWLECVKSQALTPMPPMPVMLLGGRRQNRMVWRPMLRCWRLIAPLKDEAANGRDQLMCCSFRRWVLHLPVSEGALFRRGAPIYGFGQCIRYEVNGTELLHLKLIVLYV
jgi:hypothetical protein